MLSLEVQKFIKESLEVVSDRDINSIVLTEGRSEADVYRIKVVSRRRELTGSYIVKVCDMTQQEEEKESYKAKLLFKEAPDFLEHFVKVEAEKVIGGRDVIVYHQANDSVTNMEPFSELSAEMMARYMECVSFDLLSYMNKGEQIGETVMDFFSCLLSKQLSNNGRFKDRIEGLIENSQAAYVVINERSYPNPLYFMNHISSLEECLTDQILLKGIIHGDLHGYNLIASESTYSIIDYDSVMTDAYLLFDHAYFEFSIFYDNSKDNDLKRWHSMLESLIAPSLWKDVEPCEYYKAL